MDKEITISVRVLVVIVFRFLALCGIFYGLFAGAWNHWDSSFYGFTILYSFVFRIMCGYYINRKAKVK